MTASPRCCRCDVVSDQILHEEWRRREPISPMSHKHAAIPFLDAMRYPAVRGNDAIARADLISRRVDMCDAALNSLHSGEGASRPRCEPM
jgi:hypothetical protein